MNDEHKWDVIKEMFGYVCLVVAFVVLVHGCVNCSAGKPW